MNLSFEGDGDDDGEACWLWRHFTGDISAGKSSPKAGKLAGATLVLYLGGGVSESGLTNWRRVSEMSCIKRGWVSG